ncbi:hypothetical protein [Cohnella hashimotonis]|uniref:Uncharacterized protein n=1 Tax=Cohnella hashimotonis TaxID=2826895 RepID=A0ABT6TH89_9BACL|nr:hypothetical protein [Cohnella hashimotonis]MDI4646192.1 hypothetical protein [Cohnella hashimotonis]
MEPWVTLVIAGAAIAGYGWLKPEPKAQSAAVVNEEAYDRLLEDLETENRELVDAVAAFKREQDETVSRLGLRIRELERQMEETAAHRKAESHGRGELAATRETTRLPEEPKPAVVGQAAPERLREEGLSASDSAETAARFAQPADAAAEARLAGHLAARIQEAENRPPLAVAAADTAATAPAESRGGPSDRPSAISERYAELLELHERGRSVEQIAKAMNMNKGEVQLILQLAKREVNRP